MKRLFSFLLGILCFAKVCGQTFAEKERIANEVYNKLVKAYGDSRRAPGLRIVRHEETEKVIAHYISTGKPLIEVDEQVIDICLKLKSDSLNALSIILGHELAHHYCRHTFCQDYAYAAGKNSPAYNSYIKYFVSPVNQMQYEYQADDRGLFYASAAGYNPFGIFKKLIECIYKEYILKNKILNYPTKEDRIKASKESERRALDLLAVFKAGKMLIKIGMFEEAAGCFDQINIVFDSRENHNNAGVARLLDALKLKSNNSIEFIYPVELDPVSRLSSNSTRSITDVQKADSLLEMAEKDFREAIKLDDLYTEARINLALISLIRNKKAEVVEDKLNDIPPPDTAQYIDIINLIRAIAYNKSDPSKSSSYFEMIPMGKDSIIDYDRNIFRLRNDHSGTFRKEYSRGWEQRNQFGKQATDEQVIFFNNVKSLPGILINVFYGEDNKIIINNYKDQKGMDIVWKDQKTLKAVKYDNTNTWIIKFDKNEKAIKKPIAVML